MRQYLSFGESDAFGVIATSNPCYFKHGKEDLIVVGGLERVNLWNTHLVQLRDSYRSSEHTVSVVRRKGDTNTVAVGFTDGSIRILDVETGPDGSPHFVEQHVFSMHLSRVLDISFSPDGSLMASSCQNGHVVLWDLDNPDRVGRARLHGHSGPVAGVHFISTAYLVTVGGDRTIRLWDIASRPERSLSVTAAHKSPITSSAVITVLQDGAQRTILVTGSADQELGVHTIALPTLSQSKRGRSTLEAAGGEDGGVEVLGYVRRRRDDTVRALKVLSTPGGERDVILLSAGDHGAEVWQVVHPDMKKAKKAKKAMKAKAEALDAEESSVLPADGYLTRLDTLEMASRAPLVGVDGRLTLPGPGRVRVDVMLGTGHNSLKEVTLDLRVGSGMRIDTAEASKRSGAVKERSITDQGHRGTIRGVAVSHRGDRLATAADDGVIVWATKPTGKDRVVMSFDVKGGVACVFSKCDRFVIVVTQTKGKRGDKVGRVALLHVDTGSVATNRRAHPHGATSICHAVDKDGPVIITGGNDGMINKWRLGLGDAGDVGSDSDSDDDTTSTGALTLIDSYPSADGHQEEVASLAATPKGLLAIGLLNNTVRIVSLTSTTEGGGLEPRLNLHEHHGAVRALAFSSDGELLASGSDDRTVKVWGTRFGDRHCSFRAHDVGARAVGFIPDTHHLMSTGGDGQVKLWDADAFTHYQTLYGHTGRCGALAIMHTGRVAFTAGEDRSIRAWHESESPLVADDVRQEETDRMEAEEVRKRAIGELRVAGEVDAVKVTNMATLDAGDLLHDSIELALKVVADGEPESPVLLGHTPAGFINFRWNQIRAADRETVVAHLPLSKAEALVRYAAEWIDTGAAVEQGLIAVLMVLKYNRVQLAVNEPLRPVFAAIQEQGRARLGALRDAAGVNVEALKAVMEARADMAPVEEEEDDVVAGKRKM